MAVVQNTLIGRTRNSVGGTTFGKWKNLNVLRSKPISVANPNTPAQQFQRSKFAQLVAIYRLIATAFQIGFVQFTDRMTALNGLVKYNSQTAFSGSPGSPAVLVPANFVAAKGSIADSALTIEPGTEAINISWENSSPLGAGQSLTDQIVVTAFNADLTELIAFRIPAVTRNDETATVPCPAGTVKVYAYFVSADGSQVSDSQYASITVTS